MDYKSVGPTLAQTNLRNSGVTDAQWVQLSENAPRFARHYVEVLHHDKERKMLTVRVERMHKGASRQQVIEVPEVHVTNFKIETGKK